MARTKTTHTPAKRPARTPGAGGSLKVGESIRIDGHDYDIVGIREDGLVFYFARPEGHEAGSTKYRRGEGEVADVKFAQDIGFYLPNRITPKAVDLIAAGVESGAIKNEEEGQKVLMFLRTHPRYADRDDKALKAAEDAFGITLWEV